MASVGYSHQMVNIITPPTDLQLEEYGALYQRCTWDPLLAIFDKPETEPAKNVPWEKEKVRIPYADKIARLLPE